MATVTKATSNGKPEQEAQASTPIRLRPIEKHTYEVPILGITPLIMQKWSEKALQMMRDKQYGAKAQPKRAPKEPEVDAEAATYRLQDGRAGMPATAFKAAISDAARMFEGITMTQLKISIFVEGEGPEQLVAIEGPEETREDTPRNATGVVDLRYRKQFWPWTAVLPITFPTSVLDIESVLMLVNAAGDGGVGSWRPSSPKSKSGSYGRFAVDTAHDVRQVA
jgi:hypothetical protein